MHRSSKLCLSLTLLASLVLGAAPALADTSQQPPPPQAGSGPTRNSTGNSPARSTWATLDDTSGYEIGWVAGAQAFLIRLPFRLN